MFKSRLAAWNFTKNSHDREYQICARLHKIRKQSGKPDTLFIINKDTRRSLRDLRKYIKGRKMSEEAFVALAEENVSDDQLASDQTVRAVTPPVGGGGGGLDDRDSEPDEGELGELDDANNAPLRNPAKISSASPPSFNLSHQSPPGAHDTHAYGYPYSYTPLTQLKHEYPSPSSSNAFSSSDAAMRNMLPSLPVSAAQSTTPTTPASITSHPNNMAFSHGHSQRRRRRSSCPYYDQHDVDAMAHQTVHWNPLLSTYGTNNLDSWKVLNR